MQRLSFHDQIQRNKLKSVFLILIIFFFFLVLGYIVALVYDPSLIFFIMIISIIFSTSYLLISYYNSDKIALASVKAKPADHSNPAHRQFLHSVENMSISSGLPRPRAFVMESPQINAFASGRDPQNAVICVTTGCLKKLNKQELEGVIAHEMGHIANFDIRFMTLTAVAVGMISILAEIFLRSLWFSSGSNNRDGRSQMILIIIGIALAIIAPLVSNLVSLAISRKREYSADATAVKLTRHTSGLASALKKIKDEHIGDKDKHHYAKAMAPLFISDPFKRKIQGLFSTHPPIDDRIRKIESM